MTARNALANITTHGAGDRRGVNGDAPIASSRPGVAPVNRLLRIGLSYETRPVFRKLAVHEPGPGRDGGMGFLSKDSKRRFIVEPRKRQRLE
jgi:hypothetical protein